VVAVIQPVKKFPVFIQCTCTLNNELEL